MKNTKIKSVVSATIIAAAMLFSADTFAQKRLPDGTIVYKDGTRRLPDGTVVYNGGNILQTGSNITLPDGSIIFPDGKRTYPNGNKHINNGKALPPGQAKKIYGGSAKDYAPGQQKKWNHGNHGNKGKGHGHKKN